MHEISVAQSLLEVAESSLQGHEVRRVIAINVKIGPLSGIDPDALRFAFEVVREDTRFQGTTLHVIAPAVSLECKDCGNLFEPMDFQFSCPACHSSSIRLRSGDELEIVDLEVE